MPQPKCITDMDKVKRKPENGRNRLKKVTDKYVFRVHDYYFNLINWNDPDDPIRKLVIPNEGELIEHGCWDASDEETNDAVPGCQHKHRTTALLFVSDACAAYCRNCFRKHLFRNDVKETVANMELGIHYISNHTEIHNVLLTGGDSLILAASKLRDILQRLREMEHVKTIRLGSKIPVFNPMRIYEDSELLDTIREFSTPDKRIYVMAHIIHPREITPQAVRAFQALHDAGAIVVNQTPILRGINDDPVILGELLDRLSRAGVVPYDFFVNRPVAGNREFVLPLKKVYRIVEEAKARTSGLGKSIRLSMSHSTGKIEILAIENGKAYLKVDQSHDSHYGKLMILDCPDDASWFDDLPGSGRIRSIPEEKTADAVSVHDLPYGSLNGYLIAD